MLHGVKPIETPSDQYRPEDIDDTLRVQCEEPHDISHAVSQIMEKENFILKFMPPNAPLVILTGEHHDTPSNMALQQGLFTTHLRQFKQNASLSFSVGIELPHDIYRKTPREHKLWRRAKSLLHRTMRQDPSEKQNIQAVLDHDQWSVLNFSKKETLRFCQTQGISVSFNDLSGYDCEKTKERYLDRYSDPYTNKLLEQYVPGLFPSVTTRTGSREGMAVRNIGIVDRAIKHMQRTQSRIYIQPCGQNHIFGKRNEYAYEYSLANLFHSQGCGVLPVFIDIDDQQTPHIPDDANTQNAVFIHGLSDRTVFKDSNDEANYWQRINIESGGLLGCSPPTFNS